MSYEITPSDVVFFKRKTLFQLLQETHYDYFENHQRYYGFAKQCFLRKWCRTGASSLKTFKYIYLITKHSDGRKSILEVLSEDDINLIKELDVEFLYLHVINDFISFSYKFNFLKNGTNEIFKRIVWLSGFARLTFKYLVERSGFKKSNIKSIHNLVH